MQGFSRDVVTAVCGSAGIDCRMIWDKWPNCVYSKAGEHSAGGVGQYVT